MVCMEHAAYGGVAAWGFRYLKCAPTFHQINKYDSINVIGRVKINMSATTAVGGVFHH
ncbi:MAG: hypothetical protein P1P69_00075 [Methanosarcinaceae archaeon]|nr:hypothetical protein [Methanosarcinaceae archaeon]